MRLAVRPRRFSAPLRTQQSSVFVQLIKLGLNVARSKPHRCDHRAVTFGVDGYGHVPYSLSRNSSALPGTQSEVPAM